MRKFRPFVALAALALLAARAPGFPPVPAGKPQPAVDLTKLDRRIRKEPAYQGKPKYCLLALGPQARHKVWLVLDGDTLYVDRDGDGDLTGGGEKVALPPMKQKGPGYLGMLEASRRVAAGHVREGRLNHMNLGLTQSRIRKGFVPRTDEEREWMSTLGEDRELLTLSLYVDRGGGARVWQRVGRDAGGVLRFAPSPAAAPVVHFNGRWSMGLLGGARLKLGDTPAELKAWVGTPGLGKGTFATVLCDEIVPAGARPLAEVTLPARRGVKLPPVRAELKELC